MSMIKHTTSPPPKLIHPAVNILFFDICHLQADYEEMGINLALQLVSKTTFSLISCFIL